MVLAKRLFLGRGRSITPCPTKSPTFGRIGPQAYSIGSEEKKEKEIKGFRCGIGDWRNLGISESVEKEEAEMFGLVSGFAARMRKRATRALGLTSPNVEVPSGKRPKLVGPDERLRRVRW